MSRGVGPGDLQRSLPTSPIRDFTKRGAARLCDCDVPDQIREAVVLCFIKRMKNSRATGGYVAAEHHLPPRSTTDAGPWAGGQGRGREKPALCAGELLCLGTS